MINDNDQLSQGLGYKTVSDRDRDILPINHQKILASIPDANGYFLKNAEPGRTLKTSLLTSLGNILSNIFRSSSFK